MYLSKVTIERPAARNPYEVHRAIWECFRASDGQDRPFLFRLGDVPRTGPVQALVQSDTRPDPQASQHCRFVAGPKAFQVALRKGQFLRFALCANPIRRLNQQRCRVPLIRDEDRMEWLGRKLEPAFGVHEAHVASESILYFRKRGQAGKIATVTFNGLLEVADPDGAVGLIANGIGPAKAFGITRRR